MHRGGNHALTSVSLGGGMGGTPRHRGAKHTPAPWPDSDQPSAGPSAGKRLRINSRLVLMLGALALAAVYSMAIFHAGKQAAHHTEALEAGIIVTPGKRHRKLENGMSLEEMQASLAAADRQQAGGGSSTGAGGSAAGGQQGAGSAQGQQGDAGAQGEQQQGDAGAQGEQQQERAKGGAQAVDAHLSTEGQAERERQQRHEEAAGSGAEEAAQRSVEEQGGAGGAGDAKQGGEAGQAAGEEGDEDGPEQGRSGRKSPYQQAVEKCDTLACLKEAAKEKRYKGQFIFPHFLIIGWQKCATTSLFHHLKDHPSVVTPIEKEPEFFSYDCQYNPEGCPPEMQKEYIHETLKLERVLKRDMFRLAFEGSTHYAREGQRMAQGLRRVFPWVKLIASMREPISRYLSMLGHNLDHNTYTCLKKKDLFECLHQELPWNNYTSPFTAWLEAYPREQIMLLQYESLVAPEYEAQHLKAVKSFLGIDPNLPEQAALPHSNTRAARLGQDPEGWPMKRWQYEKLIEVVRPDVDRIANIVRTYGFGDAQVWVANWEAAWKANLDGCSPEGDCTIR